MKIKNLDLQTSWSLPLGSHMLTLGGSYLTQRLTDQTGNQLAGGPSKVERYQWALLDVYKRQVFAQHQCQVDVVVDQQDAAQCQRG